MGADWIERRGTAEPGLEDEPGFDIERDLVCTADTSGHFVTANAAWERVLGWSREELLAKPFIEFVHPDDVEETLAISAQIANRDYQVARFENRYRTRDGGYRWLSWNASSDGEAWFAVAFDISEKKEREQELRTALRENRLLAYAQPIADQRTGAITRVELLARLSSVAGQPVVAPADFLPAAEDSGMVRAIDRWMAERGIALARDGHCVEVNLSAVSISDVELTGELVEVVSAAGDAARNLIFEITETAAITHLDAAREFARRLLPLGCRFALDDFGTGFGSLTYLRHLPVECLKVDVSFVRDLPRSPDDQALVRSIVAIAGELGLRTVAEGVEDEPTLDLVRNFGVDFAQGIWIGAPRPLEGSTISV